MTIRTRLGLQFMLLASLVLGGAFLAVYLLSADYRSEEFNGRLRNRGTNAAMLLIQVDEVSEALLKRIERDNPVRLPEEAIRIFDHHNTLIFHLGDEGLPPTPNALLDQVRLEGTQERRAGQREEIAFPFNDRFDRFVSALIFAPRDRYTTSVRARIGEYLLQVRSYEELILDDEDGASGQILAHGRSFCCASG